MGLPWGGGAGNHQSRGEEARGASCPGQLVLGEVTGRGRPEEDTTQHRCSPTAAPQPPLTDLLREDLVECHLAPVLQILLHDAADAGGAAGGQCRPIVPLRIPVRPDGIWGRGLHRVRDRSTVGLRAAGTAWPGPAPPARRHSPGLGQQDPFAGAGGGSGPALLHSHQVAHVGQHSL